MKRYKDLPKSAYSAITDTEYEYLGPWIKSNETAWQEFVVGSKKPYCYVKYGFDPNKESKILHGIALPHLSSIRNLARLGKWHLLINLKEGKTHKAFEDCLAVARAGSHWRRRGTIIEQLVGIAISALADNEILHIMATQDISANDLKQVQQQLSEVYSDGFPLINMEGERLFFLDMVQNVFTDGGPGGGHLIPNKWSRWMYSENDFEMWKELGLLTPLSTVISMVHAGRNKTLAKANEFYDKSAERAKMTPYENHISKLDDTDKMLFTLPEYRYFLIRYFAPASQRVSLIVYRNKATHEATITILALKRYRLENKEYPVSLDELITSGYLKELPMDPYSDKTLVYQKRRDDFILYSVGQNFIDDGGEPGKDREGRPAKWADNGDWIFWPL
jgi:hypothetical protein